jgi:hypothetical protein
MSHGGDGFRRAELAAQASVLSPEVQTRAEHRACLYVFAKTRVRLSTSFCRYRSGEISSGVPVIRLIALFRSAFCLEQRFALRDQLVHLRRKPLWFVFGLMQ